MHIGYIHVLITSMQTHAHTHTKRTQTPHTSIYAHVPLLPHSFVLVVLCKWLSHWPVRGPGDPRTPLPRRMATSVKKCMHFVMPQFYFMDPGARQEEKRAGIAAGSTEK